MSETSETLDFIVEWVQRMQKEGNVTKLFEMLMKDFKIKFRGE